MHLVSFSIRTMLGGSWLASPSKIYDWTSCCFGFPAYLLSKPSILNTSCGIGRKYQGYYWTSAEYSSVCHLSGKNVNVNKKGKFKISSTWILRHPSSRSLPCLILACSCCHALSLLVIKFIIIISLLVRMVEWWWCSLSSSCSWSSLCPSFSCCHVLSLLVMMVKWRWCSPSPS